MNVKSGLDSAQVTRLAGKKIGLVSNQTGINHAFKRTADILVEAGATIGALFGAEHGYFGVEQDGIALEGVQTDRLTGAPIYSLYRHNDYRGGRVVPNAYGPPEGSLEGLDAVVFDIQDVGARYYTYPSTLGILLEQLDLPLYVIDRPNPIGGTLVEGPNLEPEFSSFVGRYPQIPIRHGLTIGELGHFINQNLLNGRARLEVLTMEGWNRGMSWDDSGLPWVATSPNLPSVWAARVYPGTCLIEGTNLSIGRGTTQPFQLVGAPWLTEPEKLAAELNRLARPGLYFRDTFFKPMYDRCAGDVCGGVEVHIIPGQAKNEPDEIIRSGLYLVATLARLYPQDFDWLPKHFDRLIGSAKPRQFITENSGDPNRLPELFAAWTVEENLFRTQRESILLYK